MQRSRLQKQYQKKSVLSFARAWSKEMLIVARSSRCCLKFHLVLSLGQLLTMYNEIAIIVQQTKLLTWKSEVPTNSCYVSMYVVCTIYTYYLDLSTILVRISGQWKKPKRLSVRLFSTGCEFISHLVCGYFLRSPILIPTVETYGN